MTAEEIKNWGRIDPELLLNILKFDILAAMWRF